MAPQEAAVAVVAVALAALVAVEPHAAVALEVAVVPHVVVASVGDAEVAVDSHQEVSSDLVIDSKQYPTLSIFL